MLPEDQSPPRGDTRRGRRRDAGLPGSDRRRGAERQAAESRATALRSGVRARRAGDGLPRERQVRQPTRAVRSRRRVVVARAEPRRRHRRRHGRLARARYETRGRRVLHRPGAHAAAHAVQRAATHLRPARRAGLRARRVRRRRTRRRRRGVRVSARAHPGRRDRGRAHRGQAGRGESGGRGGEVRGSAVARRRCVAARAAASVRGGVQAEGALVPRRRRRLGRALKECAVLRGGSVAALVQERRGPNAGSVGGNRARAPRRRVPVDRRAPAGQRLRGRPARPARARAPTCRETSSAIWPRTTGTPRVSVRTRARVRPSRAPFSCPAGARGTTRTPAAASGGPSSARRRAPRNGAPA